MKKHKFIALFIIISLMVSAVGCSKSEKTEPIQLTKGAGSNVARIVIKDYGYFDLRLFGNEAVKEVKSFINLANSGFFDGKPVFSVIDNYCIQLGDSEALQSLENTITIDSKDTSSDKLYPFNGALCYVTESESIDTGRFMIITADTEFLNEMEELLAYKKVTPAEYYEQAYGTRLSEEELQLFKEYGGAPWLYGHCRVFGQIYEGFDTLEAISGCELSEDLLYAPLDEILIDHIEIK